MKRILAAAVAGVAIAAALIAHDAHASLVSCERTDTLDGFTLACKTQASTPATPTPPAVPVVPVPPPGPPAPPAPVDTDLAFKCPPNLSPFTCAMLAGNPIAPSTAPGLPQPAAGGNGTSFEDPTYDFRDGAIRRFVGSGTKTAIATSNAVVSFSVGDSGGNAALTWHITVAVNGRALYDLTASTYEVTTPILVHTGDVISLTISTVTGGQVIASARMALS